MAEGNPGNVHPGSSSQTTNGRYFCHTCQVPVNNISSDFTCPQCHQGFLEEIDESHQPQLPNPLGGGHGHSHVGNEANLMQLLQSVFSAVGPQADEQGQGQEFQHFFGQLLQNLNGPAGHARIQIGPQGEAVFRFGGGNLPGEGNQGQGVPNLFGFPFGNEQLHGNLQDYAWGPGGVDAIVTQLLNQIEGGVAPMTKEQVDKIPLVAITQEQVDQKTQCTTCMEEFTLSEMVKKLPCKHCFHTNCIDPWLQRHNSCPICRKSVGNGEEGGKEGEASGSSAANSGGGVQKVMDTIDELD